MISFFQRKRGLSSVKNICYLARKNPLNIILIRKYLFEVDEPLQFTADIKFTNMYLRRWGQVTRSFWKIAMLQKKWQWLIIYDIFERTCFTSNAGSGRPCFHLRTKRCCCFHHFHWHCHCHCHNTLKYSLQTLWFGTEELLQNHCEGTAVAVDQS